MDEAIEDTYQDRLERENARLRAEFIHERFLREQAEALYEQVQDRREQLRDALDHIMRVARSARQPTRRLDWIAERARRALDGQPYDQGDMPQYPKTRKDQL